jgi:pilus assembly protein Flp/PilA
VPSLNRRQLKDRRIGSMPSGMRLEFDVAHSPGMISTPRIIPVNPAPDRDGADSTALPKVTALVALLARQSFIFAASAFPSAAFACLSPVIEKQLHYRSHGKALSKNFPCAGFRQYFYLGFIRRVQRCRMIALFRKFWADDTGATAIEYGLIAAGISLAIIAVVNGLGAKLNTKFTSINTSLK